MSTETIRLLEPTIRLKNDFCALGEEFAAEGDDRYQEAISNIEKFLQLCADETIGCNLTAGRVQQSTYWLVRADERILACCRLRHTLNACLEAEAGQIGYDVRPSERRRGYGTQILRLTLNKAREMGLKQVLITSDSSNVASWRVIEKNGGKLKSEAVSRETGGLLRKYWIAL